METGRRVVLAAVALGLAAFAVGSTTTLNSGGVSSGVFVDGCTCHCGSPDSSVHPAFEGLPAEYAPGERYEFTVGFSGGPAADVNPQRENTGGFSLTVSAGVLEPNDEVQVSSTGHQATHTAESNDQTGWSLAWFAPEVGTGPVTLHLATNSVNGDGQNDNVGGQPTCLDKWNALEATVQERSVPINDESGDEPPESSASLPPIRDDSGPSPESGGTPGFGTGLAAAALFAATFRRRGRPPIPTPRVPG